MTLTTPAVLLCQLNERKKSKQDCGSTQLAKIRPTCGRLLYVRSSIVSLLLWHITCTAGPTDAPVSRNLIPPSRTARMLGLLPADMMLTDSKVRQQWLEKLVRELPNFEKSGTETEVRFLAHCGHWRPLPGTPRQQKSKGKAPATTKWTPLCGPRNGPQFGARVFRKN